MPYKDAELAKQKSAERMKKYRKKDVTPVTPENIVQSQGVTKQSVTPVKKVTPDVTPIKDIKPTDDYPPIVHYLADDVKRENLRRISDSLSNHNVSELVRFGVFGITFDKVGEILTAFPVNKRVYDSCYGV